MHGTHAGLLLKHCYAQLQLSSLPFSKFSLPRTSWVLF